MKKIIIIMLLIIGIGLMFYMNNQEAGYQSISPEEAKNKLESEENVVLLDVRTVEEYNERHIPGSILVPVDEVEDKIQGVITDKSAEVIVYCRSGNRSKTAANKLVELGYENVYDLGGINSWPYEVE